MSVLVEVLYLVSSALLIPVITLLLGLFIWALVVLGRFAGEHRERKRRTPFATEDEVRALIRDSADREKAIHAVEHFVAELQQDIERGLSHSFLAARVAPMLGLMGTLIPLGPALTGLATGDIETLAANLVVAFSTTVVGLAVAAIMTWVSTVRQRWYDGDLAERIRLYEGEILNTDLSRAGHENDTA